MRTSALVYARDGDDHVLVASNAGPDRPPARRETSPSRAVLLRAGRAWICRSTRRVNHLQLPPGWLFNIEATNTVEIQVGRKRSPATARIVTAGDARLRKLVSDRDSAATTGIGPGPTGSSRWWP